MNSIPFDIFRGVLYDECPGEREHYLCFMSETYDEDICCRCWFRYIEAREKGIPLQLLIGYADAKKERRKGQKHAQELINSIPKTQKAR